LFQHEAFSTRYTDLLQDEFKKIYTGPALRLEDALLLHPSEVCADATEDNRIRPGNPTPTCLPAPSLPQSRPTSTSFLTDREIHDLACGREAVVAKFTDKEQLNSICEGEEEMDRPVSDDEDLATDSETDEVDTIPRGRFHYSATIAHQRVVTDATVLSVRNPDPDLLACVVDQDCTKWYGQCN
jgi:hypothetical protein